jgi:hypothetical protein
MSVNSNSARNSSVATQRLSRREQPKNTRGQQHKTINQHKKVSSGFLRDACEQINECHAVPTD